MNLAMTIIDFVHIHIYCSFLDLSYVLQTGIQKNLISCIIMYNAAIKNEPLKLTAYFQTREWLQ